MTTYAQRVGVFGGTMMVVGGIIGSGIFLNPAVVAQRAGTGTLTIVAWVVGGLVAILGAFIYGELGARRPESGGGYVYLRDAWGPLPAFLYAWTLLLVIATGAIAAVAMTFASYAGAVAGLGPTAITPLALGSIVLLTSINILGVTPSSVMTSLFTLLKLAALGLLILAGFGAMLGKSVAPAPVMVPLSGSGPTLAFAGALVPVLFAYGGWQQTNFVAEELVDAPRNLPRALLWGVGIVVTVYLLANVVYLSALGVGGLADSTAPAADTMQVFLGPAGRTFIAVGIAVSTFGFLNLAICANARVYQAMARDRLFFDAFARLHPRFRTPVIALVAQGAWAAVLVLSGTYGELLDYVVFGDWIFFGLTAATLFVFRRRDARAGAVQPGFVTPVWQLSTLLFVAAAAFVVAGSIGANPRNAVRGAGLILLGVPLYLWRRRAGLHGGSSV